VVVAAAEAGRVGGLVSKQWGGDWEMERGLVKRTGWLFRMMVRMVQAVLHCDRVVDR
jgi:hypothetical protein